MRPGMSRVGSSDCENAPQPKYREAGSRDQHAARDRHGVLSFVGRRAALTCPRSALSTLRFDT
jgi:hypothetical protein